jgi:hypothetical protein
MIRVRRALLGATAVIVLAAGYSPPANADLPVIDTAAVGQLAHQLANDIKAYGLQLQQYAGEVKSWATQHLQWLQQLQQYAVQLQQYTNELTMIENWVRNPGLGAAMGLLNMAGLGSSLPVNASAVLSLVNGRSYGEGGLPEISGVLSSLSGLTAGAYSANHVYTPTDASWASRELISNANSIAGEQGAAQAAYGGSRQELCVAVRHRRTNR